MSSEDISPIAHLQSIDFVKLVDHDEAEVNHLVDICTKDGFLYLDLNNWKDGWLIKQLDDCNSIVADWFEKPFDEKIKTVTLSDAHGYKRMGQQSGVKEGQRDGYESLRLSRTCQVSGEQLPEVVRENVQKFNDFHFGSHFILKTILDALCSKMKKLEADNIEGSHKDDMQSRSALYFLHHPPKKAGEGIGQNIHTDAGTLTLLFTQQIGLQVLSPESGEWEYVQTRKGNGIVNVGDTLRFLSDERFRSALHRVSPLVDEHGNQNYDRYSTAYFLRAADEAVFVGNDGKSTTAEEWFLKKFHTFTQDISVQRGDSVAFGGMEKSLGIPV